MTRSDVVAVERSVERGKATKSEQTYWLLRWAIVSGGLEEDTPLDDAELMARFRVGRTPLREAMKRLANEEFVIWPPHRTPYVRTTSAQDLAQLYEARQIFEIPAARFAAQRAIEPDLADLEKYCDQLDDAIASGDMYEVAECDYDFHVGVAKASKNRFLVEAVSHLNCGSLRLWYRNYVQLGTDRISDDHRKILRALRRRNPDDAAKVGRAHIQFSHDRQLILHGLTPSASRSASAEGPTPRGRRL